MAHISYILMLPGRQQRQSLTGSCSFSADSSSRAHGVQRRYEQGRQEAYPLPPAYSSGRIDSLSIHLSTCQTSLLLPTFSSICNVKNVSITLQGNWLSESPICDLVDFLHTASPSLESLRLGTHFISTPSPISGIFTSQCMYSFC